MKKVSVLHIVAYICIIVCSALFVGYACLGLPVFSSNYLGDAIVDFFTGGFIPAGEASGALLQKMIWAIVYIVFLVLVVTSLVVYIVRACQKKQTKKLGLNIVWILLFFVVVSLYFFTYYGSITAEGSEVDRIFLESFTALGDPSKISVDYFASFLVILGMSLTFIAYIVLEVIAYVKTLKLVEKGEVETSEATFAGLTEDEVRQAVREELAAFFENKEETVEEPVVEETKEEAVEEKVEETPVEETVEETVTEEVVEETPEEKVEESVEETPVVEEKVEETPVVEEPATADTNANARLSFFDRILLVDDELLDIYNEIKNDILSYGVKSRVSSAGDTFRLHRVTYMKMIFAGKKVKLYMKLNPEDFADSTIPHDNAGDKKLYEEIPFVFKVKSGLSIRRAKALIAEMMEKEGIQRVKEPGNVDYARELIAEIKSKANA